jgi:hypothetical protein
VKELSEPGDCQAGSLEDRFEGLGLENSLAMDGNGHAMREAVARSAVQVDMATFLIEHHANPAR